LQLVLTKRSKSTTTWTLPRESETYELSKKPVKEASNLNGNKELALSCIHTTRRGEEEEHNDRRRNSQSFTFGKFFQCRNNMKLN
uniref:Ovule protein n=1 Tax=Ascaris lumbricoides TaxID=6252 RepID=A0A0M3IMK6_ASCLU